MSLTNLVIRANQGNMLNQ